MGLEELGFNWSSVGARLRKTFSYTNIRVAELLLLGEDLLLESQDAAGLTQIGAKEKS